MRLFRPQVEHLRCRSASGLGSATVSACARPEHTARTLTILDLYEAPDHVSVAERLLVQAEARGCRGRLPTALVTIVQTVNTEFSQWYAVVKDRDTKVN